MNLRFNIVQKIKQKGLQGVFNTVKNRGANSLNLICVPIKLRKLVKEQEIRLANGLNIGEIRQRTLSYIESMHIKDTSYGIYKYSKSQTKPVLYASIYAVLTRHLYKDLDNLTGKQRKEWINYIQSFQDEDGLFKDPAVENDIAANSDWWGWRHLTLHAIMALTCLGAIAKKRFTLVEPFKNKDFVIKWLENRDWGIDPATTSNQVQNYFTILQYVRDFHGVEWAHKAIETAYEWLDKHQDRDTGLWGTRFDTPLLLSHGVQTGYHIWLLYFYDNRQIQYVEKIIDSCLATQNELGGYGVPLNSSACEDIDSIDPLIRLLFMNDGMTEYRKQDVYESLQRAMTWILTNMNEDGGFVFRRMEPFIYGHSLMASKRDESAMFPTWFRTLSLAYLTKTLPDSFLGKFDWQFIDCPGLQFWKD